MAPAMPPGTVHLSIDMQRVFAEKTDWHMPNFYTIVPNIAAISRAMPGRTLFTRFVTPHMADHATGHWQNYYRRWQIFTGAVMAPELIEIDDALAEYATPDALLDKPTYSAFEVPECAEWLTLKRADTIIFTGVETDVCVLASLLAAVDRGFRVIAVRDALASSSEAGHLATLDAILPRMPDQIDIVTTAEVLAALGAG